MRVFTVHTRGGDKPRTELVREGFSFAATLFGPLWLLWKGLWLALLGYLILGTALAFLPEPWAGWAGLAMQLLLGFHARDLQRWTLRRGGLVETGAVVAPDEELALLRLLRARPDLARGAMA